MSAKYFISPTIYSCSKINNISVAHRDHNINSITKNISISSGKEELEADIFAAEAIIDDDTFLDYLKFYKYTDTQIACDLNIPVKYVRLKYKNFDKSKLFIR